MVDFGSIPGKPSPSVGVLMVRTFKTSSVASVPVSG